MLERSRVGHVRALRENGGLPGCAPAHRGPARGEERSPLALPAFTEEET